MEKIILEVKAGEFDRTIEIYRRPKINDVDVITRRIFLHLGAAAKDAGFPLDYFDSQESISFRMSYEGRVETEVFNSVDEMFRNVHIMVDNIIVVEN